MHARLNSDADQPNVERRKFLNGRWRLMALEAPVTEIASIVVQVRPQHLDGVAHALETLPGAQIFSRDSKGKLVVVLEAPDVGSLGTMFNMISLMPRVLTAALVFHGTDER